MLLTRIKANLQWYLVIGLYHLLLLVIIWISFPKAGQFLTGWDELHPEFNFSLSWQRSLYSVWQENYGAGALVGHGFAALLPHTTITWLMSLLLPLWAIRPAFVLLSYYLGGLGMLLLARQLLWRLFKQQSFVLWLSLVAALFYLFNLGTVQQFYLPLEAFVVQFALLPWFFWSLNRYWQKPIRVNLGLFTIFNLLGSIQGFIPVLFVVLALVFITYQLVLLSGSATKESIKKTFILGLVFLGINAYWLLPLGYYVRENSGDFLHAYNNQVSTPEFVAKSEAYGTLSDVAFLKSFYLEGEQPSGQVFGPWLKHIESGWYQAIGWGVFGLIMTGWIYLLLQGKDKVVRSYPITGLVIFGFLATQLPPFSWFMQFLYDHSSLFEQVFRTSFTKFGLMLGGYYSLFLVIGMACLINRLRLWLPRIVIGISVFLFLGLAIYQGWPIFKGNLFNKQLVIQIPDSYFQVMDYFATAGDGRIAELPIECSEGWYSRDWGYYGSGFLWFGIKQPYMSRTFDVWSRFNENFYFEARYALRQPDYQGFDDVLRKYDINFLYMDENLNHCQGGKGMEHLENLTTYLSGNADFELVGKFEDPGLKKPLRVYKLNSEISKTTNAPVSYIAANLSLDEDNDKVYAKYGTYLETKTRPSVSFPFNSSSFRVEKDAVIVRSESLQSGNLKIPSYQETERYLPLKITLNRTARTNSYLGLITLLGPQIQVNGTVVLSPPNIDFGPVEVNDLNELQLATDNIPMKKISDTEFIGTYFVGSVNNVISRQNGVVESWWSSSGDQIINDYMSRMIDQPIKEDESIEILIPKIFDQGAFGNVIKATDFGLPEDCSNLAKVGQIHFELSPTVQDSMMRVISQNDDACVRARLEDVYTAGGYIIQFASKHVQGMPLRYELTNWHGISYLGNYLGSDSEIIRTTLLAPPVFAQDLNYTLEFKNRSFGNIPTINDVYEVEYWFVPYRYITSANITNSATVTNALIINQVKKLNPLKYEVDVSGNGLLVLSQGYDGGWLAKQNSHPLPKVKINGWQNGWVVPVSGNVTIFYWPQLLEWLGLGLVPLTFLYVILSGWNTSRWSVGRKEVN